MLTGGCGDLDTDISSLTISPSSATVGINQSQLFTVTAKNGAGMIVEVDPTWGVTENIGTVTSSGLFTANATAGQGSVVATYGDVSDQATVTVTTKCWVAGRVTGEMDPGGVENILVKLRGTAYQDRTDDNGEYSISNVLPGTYDLYSQEDHQIYISVSEEVTVASGETATVNLYLTVRPGVVTTTSITIPTF